MRTIAILIPAALGLGLSACPRLPRAAAPGDAPVPEAATHAPAGPRPPARAGTAGPVPGHVARRYACAGRLVSVDFDNDAGVVRIEKDAEILELAVAASGSGARYTDAAGNEFWEHQGQARLALAGRQARTCRPVKGRGGTGGAGSLAEACGHERFRNRPRGRQPDIRSAPPALCSSWLV